MDVSPHARARGHAPASHGRGNAFADPDSRPGSGSCLPRAPSSDSGVRPENRPAAAVVGAIVGKAGPPARTRPPRSGRGIGGRFGAAGAASARTSPRRGRRGREPMPAPGGENVRGRAVAVRGRGRRARPRRPARRTREGAAPPGGPGNLPGAPAPRRRPDLDPGRRMRARGKNDEETGHSTTRGRRARRMPRQDAKKKTRRFVNYSWHARLTAQAAMQDGGKTGDQGEGRARIPPRRPRAVPEAVPQEGEGHPGGDKLTARARRKEGKTAVGVAAIVNRGKSTTRNCWLGPGRRACAGGAGAGGAGGIAARTGPSPGSSRRISTAAPGRAAPGPASGTPAPPAGTRRKS